LTSWRIFSPLGLSRRTAVENSGAAKGAHGRSAKLRVCLCLYGLKRFGGPLSGRRRLFQLRKAFESLSRMCQCCIASLIVSRGFAQFYGSLGLGVVCKPGHCSAVRTGVTPKKKPTFVQTAANGVRGFPKALRLPLALPPVHGLRAAFAHWAPPTED